MTDQLDRTAPAESAHRSLLVLLRGSALPYLAVLGVAALASWWAQYLFQERSLVKGQPASIVVFGALFLVSVAAWLMLADRRPVHAPLGLFLGAMLLTWVTHIALAIHYANSFNHTVWLLPVILLMIVIKPPTSGEAWDALVVLALAAAVVLAGTRLLEIAGVISTDFVPAYVVDYEKAHYWLPLSGHLGVDGRWPGPFGHNSNAASMAAMMIVIAVARWRRVTSPILVIVGTLTLLLTMARSGLAAAVVGVALIAVLSGWGLLKRTPMWFRGVAVLAAGAVVAIGVTVEGPGLTGRDRIWPAYLDVWQTSPWIGTSTADISAAGEVTARFTQAHSMFLDELTRYGLLGFLALMAALVIGLVIVSRAALRGVPGPLAVVVAYLITVLTDMRNDWLHPSAMGMVVILCVAAAAASLAERAPTEVAAR